MEKKMENEMETGIVKGLIKAVLLCFQMGLFGSGGRATCGL